MHPAQATNSSASERPNSLIDRVLDLRRQLGIDIPLSIRDAEDIPFSPREMQESSLEVPRHTPPIYDSRDWLVWNQSPSGRNLPEEKGPDVHKPA